MLLIGLPLRLLGNMNPSPSLSLFASLSIAKARLDKGTRCSRRAFILTAGTVQVAASRSISDHSAPLTSPALAAVSTINSNANFIAGWEVDSRTRCSAAGTSA